MILTVIKNSLLAILIILILHIILKNEVFEQTEKMKKYISSNNNGSMEESKKKVQFHDDIIPSKNSMKKTKNPNVDINTNNATDNEDDKDCPNSLTCADFKLPDKKLDTDEMKELYDYVFEKHDTDQALETVFNNDDKVIHVDMTELDRHINDISETQTKEDNLLCSFEIIGIIENTEDDIGGVDMFSQNHLFSKVI